jgi:hypothetical protein
MPLPLPCHALPLCCPPFSARHPSQQPLWLPAAPPTLAHTVARGNGLTSGIQAALPGGKNLTDVQQLSGGAQHAFVLLTNGTLLVGAESGFTAGRPPPGLVTGRIVRVSAGNAYSLAVDAPLTV